MIPFKLLNRCLLSGTQDALQKHRDYSSLAARNTPYNWSKVLLRRSFNAKLPSFSLRRRQFSTSNFLLREDQKNGKDDEVSSEAQLRRRQGRSPSVKTSLRRVAVEAQRSRDGMSSEGGVSKDMYLRSKRIRAYCGAEQYDIAIVIQSLQKEGYHIDPYETGLLPQVVHVQVPLSTSSNHEKQRHSHKDYGDLFVFPSGTVVAWSLPDSVTSDLVTNTLLPAAQFSHVNEMETEDMEYVEDSNRENSSIKGDTIILGTKAKISVEPGSASAPARGPPSPQSPSFLDDIRFEGKRVEVDTILAKIAFSSGLARSTKLAVLESLLRNYFDSTRTIPTMLSRGSRLPFTRSFILRKTGQLLSVRAQLNLYSELTDSLPDLFWDSRYELGLEGYYDQVGRALDVGVRIKVLNEKMDYAQEIASVLRERLSEKHGLVLEWMIIALITIEVGFEILRLWKERKEAMGRGRHEISLS
ncbi:MAG: hypothetical protein M1837_002893 [Sclerophora amabilis]|nr:MAG: hypothetical protein M1837_002893 [Sclerophora amabilis]